MDGRGLQREKEEGGRPAEHVSFESKQHLAKDAFGPNTIQPQ